MATQIFINLPVHDLTKAIAFYTAIGAVQNLQFSDDSSGCMALSESIFLMLMTHEKWSMFTRKPIADARQASEAMFAISADRRQAVDEMLEAAGAQGGIVDVNPAQDLGFLYNRSFQDPDGHIWEAVFMDMAQMPASS